MTVECAPPLSFISCFVFSYMRCKTQLVCHIASIVFRNSGTGHPSTRGNISNSVCSIQRKRKDKIFFFLPFLPFFSNKLNLSLFKLCLKWRVHTRYLLPPTSGRWRRRIPAMIGPIIDLTKRQPPERQFWLLVWAIGENTPFLFIAASALSNLETKNQS